MDARDKELSWREQRRREQEARRKAERRESIIMHMLAALVILAIIAGVIWIRSAIPCSWIDFMPVQDVPTRCLTVEVR